MRYKVVLMSGDWQSDWYDTEHEAWEYIKQIGCLNYSPCEQCQAEYDVFSEQELDELNKKG